MVPDRCAKCGKFLRAIASVDNGCVVIAGKCRGCGSITILDISYSAWPQSPQISRMQ